MVRNLLHHIRLYDLIIFLHISIIFTLAVTKVMSIDRCKCRIFLFNNSDGQVVRAFASVTVESGVIPSRVKPMTFMGFPHVGVIDRWPGAATPKRARYSVFIAFL